MHQHSTGSEAINRLESDLRTLSPAGIERVAWGWRRHEGHPERLHVAEQAALHVIEQTDRGPNWEDLRRTLNNLMAELDEMRTAWQGAGGRSFEQVRQEWARDQATLNEALGATADALRGASRNYTASDSNAADRVARSARITLPLGGRS